MEAPLHASYDLARQLARQHGKSFYFASFFLPPARARAMFALYAFCRTADDLIDDRTGSVTETRTWVARMRSQLLAIYDGGPEPVGLFIALADTIRRYDIPREPFLELLEGVELDLDPRPYETYAQLASYCYKVASTVGLMLAHVFGFQDARALTEAARMGAAMQLTNILRDVGTDLGLGRVYLPTEDLEAFGLTTEDLIDHVVDERFVALMQFEIARARALYEEAHAGIRFLDHPLSRLTAHLMGRIYGGILDAIEAQGYDVYAGRAHVSTAAKLRIAGATLLEVVRRYVPALRPAPVGLETRYSLER